MPQARYAGYILSSLCTLVFGCHAFFSHQQGKDINYPFTLGIFMVAGWGLGLPVQELDLQKLLGMKRDDR